MHINIPLIHTNAHICTYTHTHIYTHKDIQIYTHMYLLILNVDISVCMFVILLIAVLYIRDINLAILFFLVQFKYRKYNSYTKHLFDNDFHKLTLIK